MELTKPQYAVMRVIKEHPGIESGRSDRSGRSSALKRRWRDVLPGWKIVAGKARKTIRWINVGVFVYLTVQAKRCSPPHTTGDRVDDEFLGRLSAEEREQFLRNWYQQDDDAACAARYFWPSAADIHFGQRPNCAFRQAVIGDDLVESPAVHASQCRDCRIWSRRTP